MPAASRSLSPTQVPRSSCPSQVPAQPCPWTVSLKTRDSHHLRGLQGHSRGCVDRGPHGARSHHSEIKVGSLSPPELGKAEVSLGDLGWLQTLCMEVQSPGREWHGPGVVGARTGWAQNGRARRELQPPPWSVALPRRQAGTCGGAPRQHVHQQPWASLSNCSCFRKYR